MRSKNHKGAAGEMLAAIALMQGGYDVFRSVAAAARCDLIAVNATTGATLTIEVKTGTLLPSSGEAYVSPTVLATIPDWVDHIALIHPKDQTVEWAPALPESDESAPESDGSDE